jgi:acetyl esterase
MTTVPAHPQLAEIAAMLRRQGLSPADPLTTPLAEARFAATVYNSVWNEAPPPVAKARDLGIAVGDRVVPVRILYPENSREDLPVLLYFHGGGFVLNGIDTHDRLTRLLALGSGAAVVVVGYGLAPEHRFPSQIDDALAAVAWVRREGSGLGLDASRLALGGDSAGATLALAAQLALRERGLPPVAFGLLLYGMFSARLDTPSHAEFGDGRYGLSTARVDWFWQQYLSDGAQRDNPLAAPLHAEFAGLPPQLVIAAGLDCLRDDSRAVADRLRTAGVPVRLSVYEGVPHSFMQMSAYLEPARHAVAEAAAAVTAALGGDRYLAAAE